MLLSEVKGFKSTSKDFTQCLTTKGFTLKRDSKGAISIFEFVPGDTVEFEDMPCFYQSEKKDRTILSIGGWFVNLHGIGVPNVQRVKYCKCDIAEGRNGSIFLNVDQNTFDFED